MTLDELGAYLAANITGSTSLTLGTNLFLGRLPDTPDTCVALFETGGTFPSHTMGGASSPVFERGRLQVVTRAAGYATARTLAGSVWSTFENVADESLSSVYYLRVTAVQSPFAIERDSRDRILIAQNFDVMKSV